MFERELGYLAGLIDGEGCVTGGSNREIVIGMTDLGPLNNAKEACELLGYKHYLRGPYSNGEGRKHYWVLTITSFETLTRCLKELQLTEPKRGRLEHLLTTYKRTSHPLTKEEVEDIRKGRMSAKSYAALYGVSSSSVYDVLKRTGRFA